MSLNLARAVVTEEVGSAEWEVCIFVGGLCVLRPCVCVRQRCLGDSGGNMLSLPVYV